MSHPQSIVRDRVIACSLWLIFDAVGGVRMTRKRPSMSAGERGLALNVMLPTALFRTPELSATIDVPDVGDRPATIDLKAASDALEAAIGCQVELRIVPPETGA